MSFTSRASASARRLVRNFSTGEAMTIRRTGGTTFGDDLSVTVSPEEYSVQITTPLDLTGRDFAGDRVPEGHTYVYFDKYSPGIQFDPQPGMFALKADGEQFRVDEVKDFHGAWRLLLSGASPGGLASS